MSISPPYTVLPPDTHYAVSPYNRTYEIPSAGSVRPVPGTIVPFDIQNASLDRLRRLRAPVHRLRAKSGLTVALRVRNAPENQAALLVAHAYAFGVRAIVGVHGRMRRVLWTWLTHPVDIAADWIELVRVQRPDASPVTLHCARRIIEVSESYDDVGELLSSDGFPRAAQTIRRRLRDEGLPKAERWYNGARLLRAQLRLQRDPDRSRYAEARDLGYRDWESCSNEMYDVFGVTGAAACRLLGLEWRFRGWWTRSARDRI